MNPCISTSSVFLLVGLVVPLILSSPTQPNFQARSTTFCGQNDLTESGNYILYNNLWGESSATSGYQCTTLHDLLGSDIEWHTAWTWEGGDDEVKSYANVVVDFTPAKLDTYSHIYTTWDWSYTGTSINADVSYDTFLGTTASASSGSQFEVMIWLAALGSAFPISSTGLSPIATPTLGGHAYRLYSGYNGSRKVYTFVAASPINSYDGDLMDFFTYLEDNEDGFSGSEYYLQSVGAGTEAFTGEGAVFTTGTYKVFV